MRNFGVADESSTLSSAARSSTIWTDPLVVTALGRTKTLAGSWYSALAGRAIRQQSKPVRLVAAILSVNSGGG